MKKLRLCLSIVLFMLMLGMVNAQTDEQGLREGAKAPDFTLNNQNGIPINLYTLLEKGPVILNWYRGGWCPYCNIALKAFAGIIPEINSEGASFVAISPELPDKSLNTIEKDTLSFMVLSDINNKVGHQYDIVFKLSTETADKYEKGFGLSTYNGNTNNELPIPATYIIDQNGIIRYAYINPDYRHRANPIEVLKKLKIIEKIMK